MLACTSSAGSRPYSLAMGDNVPALRPDGDPEPSRELRASHEDRDQVVELLRTAAGDGRITVEELDERIEAALTARTYRELAVLTTDLPAVPRERKAARRGPPAEPTE